MRSEIGSKYGKLTILGVSRAGGNGVGTYLHTACDCGRTREVLRRRLRAGAVTHCGYCTSSGKKAKPGARLPEQFRLAYRKMLMQAARKGGAQLSPTEYREKVEGARCVACNASKPRGEWGEPTGPFNVTNLIPICTECSEMRRGRSIRKTLEWLIRVHRHLQRVSMQEFR